MTISNNPSVSAAAVPTSDRPLESTPIASNSGSCRQGVLIINADDWGRDTETTDRILECIQLGAVSSASAMVFMEDSERAAALAHDRGVDVGLHLNLTTPFSGSVDLGPLTEHHNRVSHFLLRSRLSRIVYHPGLASSFEYLVAAQLDEFRRLYGVAPDRIDGHHHMHLSANVLLGGLLPSGTIARRNFSFGPEEKSVVNRFYRGVMDRILAKRHRLTDFFFSLPPIETTNRLRRIFCLARKYVVELETHPINPEEYRYLTAGELLIHVATPIAAGFDGFLRSASS